MYMRPSPPPPPSMADPHHQLPLPPQPAPPPGSWYSNQYHYHSPQQFSSPTPPPHQQWAPPPHADHPPYSSYPLYNDQYPRPPLPPRPPVPRQHHITQSYPQVNQDWGTPNWGQHQGWEYPAHNNEEDWATKARAWAAAKTALDNGHAHSQFTHVDRLEEQSHNHDQYTQTVDPHYSDVQQASFPASSYQQYPASAAPAHRSLAGHLQESASFSSGQSSYVPYGHLPYTARNEMVAGDSNAVFPHQESSSTIPSVHQQEVPSSYSSVAGKEESGDQNGKFYGSLPIASTHQHHVQSPLLAIGRSSMNQPHYAFANQSAEPTAGLSDEPLDFAPRFSHDHDPHVQPNYTHDSGGAVRGLGSVAAMPSVHAWTPSATPGIVYPPIPPSIQSGQQVDPSVPAHFGGIPGPSFQQSIPSVSAIHPTAAFPIDAYGVTGVPERPKKASVPNWLREEIIKKTAVITSSAPEFPKEESRSIDDEGADKSLGKSYQADSKSIDSSRSTEDDDDNEDYVEAARTAAVNQEIKRVLTEVLLKVTDELFDDIATKVLSEDTLTVEVAHNVAAPDHKVAPAIPAVPTPKASAKVLIPAKTKVADSDDVSGKSTSSSTGDVLGLASYASDDDEADVIRTSSKPNSKENIAHKQPVRAVENGSSQAGNEEDSKNHRYVDSHAGRMSLNGVTAKHSAAVSKLSDNRGGRESAHGDVESRFSSKTDSAVAHEKPNVSDEKVLDDFDASMPKDGVGEKVSMKTELPVENFNAKMSSTDDFHGRETRNNLDKNDGHEIKRSSASKDRAHEKVDEFHGRQDERHVKKERVDDRNGSKERMKEEGAKFGKKAKGSDSRKRLTHSDVKDDTKETERDKGASAKVDDDKKRERTKDGRGERSRHKTSNSGRHKRRRSSSGGSGGRHNKEKSVVSHANDSSDESSDESKRKLHSKRRESSPSPVRSRRRYSFLSEQPSHHFFCFVPSMLK